MAIKSVSSSMLVHRNEGMPSKKQMLRTTSEKFKGSSNLLGKAIGVHAEEKEALLSTIRKLSEENQKLRTANEQLEGKSEKEHLIDQKKIRELNRGIENLSEGFKAIHKDIEEICKNTLHRQSQVGICLEAVHIHNILGHVPNVALTQLSHWAHVPGHRTCLAQFELLKSMLDAEYKEWATNPDPISLFGLALESDVNAIQRKLTALLKEHEALEAIAKNMPQEKLAEQN